MRVKPSRVFYLYLVFHGVNRYEGFPGSAVVKNPFASARDGRDSSSIPGLGRSPGEGNVNPFQYSCLGNPMGSGAWWDKSMGFQRVGHDLGIKSPSIYYESDVKFVYSCSTWE